jgi:predicted permease
MRRRKRMMENLDQDIRDFIERETQDNIERGMPPEEAHYAALRKFGNATRVKEETREVWSSVWLEQLWQDVGYGLRQLRHTPGFTTAAILSLALGIGANTAAFSLVNAALLRPLPLPFGERVASIKVIPTLPDQTGGHSSPAQLLAWGVNNHNFDLLAAVGSSRAQISGVGEPEEARILQVSANIEELAGIHPQLGRGFSVDDFRSGSTQVCLISTRLWQHRFSADRSVVGQSLYVDSVPTTIIGVLPQSTVFPDAESELWIPLRFSPEHRTQRSLDVYGRLRPGISTQGAQAWLNQATARAESGMPEWLRTRQVIVTPIREQLISDEKTLLLVLSGIAVCVLLICCANVGNLLLARHLKREREMALRASLGATLGRLVRQLLAEALLLCAAGGLAGCLAGRVLVSFSDDFLSASRFKSFFTTGDQFVDGGVAAFTIFLAFLTSLSFGLAPSLHVKRLDLNEALKASPRGQGLNGGGFLVNRYLVAVELAIAFVLLTGGGLLVQSFDGLISVQRGYAVDHLLTARLPIRTGETLARRKQFFRQLVEQLKAVPDVRAVGVVTGLPLGGLNATMTLPRPGQTLDPENLPWAGINCVNADYFKAMGINILRGRGFDSSDDENGMPVAIINETLARQFWPNRDAIGQELMPGTRVVGIVPDIRQEALDTSQGPAFYLPFDQRDGLAAAPNFVVIRTKGDPKTLVPTLRSEVRSTDRLQPIQDTRTMDQVLGRSVTQRRLLTSLMTVLASLALVLSLVGIYGVLSYQVSSHRREIGVRMCLGAPRSSILIFLGRQLSTSVAAGLLAGFVVSFTVGGALSHWLFAVSPHDPFTLIAAALVTTAAAMLGGAVPAIRALRVDPLTAVRTE